MKIPFIKEKPKPHEEVLKHLESHGFRPREIKKSMVDGEHFYLVPSKMGLEITKEYIKNLQKQLFFHGIDARVLKKDNFRVMRSLGRSGIIISPHDKYRQKGNAVLAEFFKEVTRKKK
ncbi:hypothetical protein HY989_03975 [Candidatus Micrarchaeota archaeon]|nr:hypothetical protein [Candidatus Micrarchaeota archaeon]